MKVFTTDSSDGRKRCGLFDDWPTCTDPNDPHYVEKPAKPIKRIAASRIPRISLTVFSESSLRKRAAMKGKKLQAFLWRYREQAGKSNGAPRLVRRRASDPLGGDELFGKRIVTRGKVIATTDTCLRRLAQQSYGRENEHLSTGQWENPGCDWCQRLAEAIPLHGTRFDTDAERKALRQSLQRLPACVGAERLLNALATKKQLTQSARRLCAELAQTFPQDNRAPTRGTRRDAKPRSSSR